MLTILCFGDSITLGEKDLEQGGWADCLKKQYFNQFSDCQTQEITLYNLGVAGETTDGLVNRLDGELRARHIKNQNLIVVFAYGANDIVVHRAKGKNIVPELYFVRNIKNCIAIAKQFKAEILLLNILPIADATEGKINQYGQLKFDHDIQAYNFKLKKLADEVSCEYLDLYTTFVKKNKAEYLSSDGVHPNSKGHELLYQNIKQKLLTLRSYIL